jgi:hypothetical protein
MDQIKGRVDALHGMFECLSIQDIALDDLGLLILNVTKVLWSSSKTTNLITMSLKVFV